MLPLVYPGSPLLGLANSAPLLRSGQVLLIHDAAVFDIPDCFRASYRLFYRSLYAGLQFTDVTVCTVSDFSAERLTYHLPGFVGRIVVVPPGADHVHRVRAVR